MGAGVYVTGITKEYSKMPKPFTTVPESRHQH
jgi:hypothetical protein